MKRSHEVDLDALMESLEKERNGSDDPWNEYAGDSAPGDDADN